MSVCAFYIFLQLSHWHRKITASRNNIGKTVTRIVDKWSSEQADSYKELKIDTNDSDEDNFTISLVLGC